MTADTHPTPASNDDVLALFAELGRTSDELMNDDGFSPDARASLELEHSHILNELRTAVVGTGGAFDGSDELYMTALQHDDPYVVEGLVYFVDDLLGIHDDEDGLRRVTFGVAVEARFPGASSLGAVSDVEPLQKWASQHLGLPFDQLHVHPVPSAPGVAFEGLLGMMQEVLCAKTRDAESVDAASWTTGLSNETVAGDAQLVVFWVTATLKTAEEEAAAVEKWEMGLELLGTEEGVRVPFSLGGETRVATLNPLSYDFPMSALSSLAFAPAFTQVHQTVDTLVEKEIAAAEDIIAELRLTATGTGRHPLQVQVELLDANTGLVYAQFLVERYQAFRLFTVEFLQLAEDLGLRNVGCRVSPLEPLEFWFEE